MCALRLCQLWLRYLHRHTDLVVSDLVSLIQYEFSLFKNVFIIAFQAKRPLLLAGDTGTSKTAIITNFLRGLDSDKYVSNSLYLFHPLLTFKSGFTYFKFIKMHFLFVFSVTVAVEFLVANFFNGCPT